MGDGEKESEKKRERGRELKSECGMTEGDGMRERARMEGENKRDSREILYTDADGL